VSDSPQTQEDKAAELMLDHVYRGMLLRALSAHYLLVKDTVDMHRAKRLAEAGLLECRTDGYYQKEYVPTKAAKDMLA
jgi:hypothetical protein